MRTLHSVIVQPVYVSVFVFRWEPKPTNQSTNCCWACAEKILHLASEPLWWTFFYLASLWNPRNQLYFWAHSYVSSALTYIKHTHTYTHQGAVNGFITHSAGMNHSKMKIECFSIPINFNIKELFCISSKAGRSRLLGCIENQPAFHCQGYFYSVSLRQGCDSTLYKTLLVYVVN